MGNNSRKYVLRNTGDRFLTQGTGYKTFLASTEDKSRLTILDNYKQIMRVMTNSYVTGEEKDKRFRNRTERENLNDPDYHRFKDE